MRCRNCRKANLEVRPQYHAYCPACGRVGQTKPTPEEALKSASHWVPLKKPKKKPSRRFVTPAEASHMQELYDSGLSLAKVAKVTKRNHLTVASHVKTRPFGNRLTNDDIANIRRHADGGYSITAIAKLFKISLGRVKGILLTPAP